MQFAVQLLLSCHSPGLHAQVTEPIRVDARCVDPDGRPLAGVMLADHWQQVDVTDETGETTRLYGCSWGAIVVDRDGRLLMHGSLVEAIARLEKQLGATAASKKKP
ncbi:MAG: hypothetical protein KDC95_07710 [Planctomycetes bacterium]|nr:hypothetical protein [Planctomycetota bacterium]